MRRHGAVPVDTTGRARHAVTVLRTHSPVRALTVADHDDVLAVCARDPRANVFVSARVLEGALATSPGSVLGFDDGGDLEAVCWASANLVPVGCDAEATPAFAAKVRKWRRQCASLFGPADMVLGLWQELVHLLGHAARRAPAPAADGARASPPAPPVCRSTRACGGPAPTRWTW